MSDDSSQQVTRILQQAADGDRAAADALIPLVYDQLRATAQIHLMSERPGHTLQATALVHDAYVQLIGPREVPWQNRAHFYAAAAQAMRRLLIDHARKHARRGGKPRPLAEISDVVDLANADSEQILAVDQALRRLEGDHPDAAAVVRLRFFAGLSVEQAAESLGVSPRSVARMWAFARAQLFQELSEQRDAQN